MDVRETFIRGEPLRTEFRQLPADIYNLSHLLLVKSSRDSLFIPIRSIQYLAVIDKEEIIFVDGMDKRSIKISWKKFTPQVRERLTDPVPYSLVLYHSSALEIMQRLQGEYSKAVKLEAAKYNSDHGPSKIIQLSDKK